MNFAFNLASLLQLLHLSRDLFLPVYLLLFRLGLLCFGLIFLLFEDGEAFISDLSFENHATLLVLVAEHETSLPFGAPLDRDWFHAKPRAHILVQSDLDHGVKRAWILPQVARDVVLRHLARPNNLG
mmetsp:Transcript_34744/g.45711  ORF Transcript_34744/g.45711 Transcript_34744/m.45711 type:complete len:127 (-) Transcript_34744:366-746(-)